MITPILPEAFKIHLPERLEDNKANYPEFNVVVDDELVAIARDRLLQLPLLHASDWICKKQIESDGLIPLSQISDPENHNTYSLDKSLGLDNAVFSVGETFMK